MWVFLNDAFVSIVAHRTKPDYLLVRARLKGDLERLFPGAAVQETRQADYRFRAELPRSEVGAALARRATELRYDTFKRTITEPDRHDAYVRAWEAMANLQRRRHGD